MSNELALSNGAGALFPSVSEWQTMGQMAEVLVKSGFLPESVRTTQQALAIMLKGKELAIPPMQAFASINIIKGKPTLAAELMSALVMRAGHALRVVETNEQKCTVEIQRKGQTFIYRQSFTIQEAEKAGLLSNPTWTKYRAAMLRARCISAACRVECPDVIMGMYTPEELGADVAYTEDGQEIVITQPAAPLQLVKETDPIEGFFKAIAESATLDELQEVGKEIKAFGSKGSLIRRKELQEAYASRKFKLLKPALTPAEVELAPASTITPEPEDDGEVTPAMLERECPSCGGIMELTGNEYRCTAKGCGHTLALAATPEFWEK